jgi:DNA repair protein RecO (recombination protein O)
MRISDRAIVLQSIRHGDRKYILKLYTRGHGLLTAVAVPGRSASSKIRRSALLPLSLVDVQMTVRHNHDMQLLTEAACYLVRPTATSVNALAVAQFMNELLIKCLREQHANEHMYALVESSVMHLGEGDPRPNFHLQFMKELTAALGFEPQNNYSASHPYFDCREGSFSSLALSFPLGLNREDSLLFSEYLGCDVTERQLSKAQRNFLLEAMEAYFGFHIPGFGQLRSVAVVREVLNDR